MKRLTISMSDDLFDKLEVIENKSLFIRKLIERELDMLDNTSQDDIIPWTEKFQILRDEVSSMSGRLELIEKNFTEIGEMSEKLQTGHDIPATIENVEESTIEDTPLPESNMAEEIMDTGNVDSTEENKNISLPLAKDIQPANVESSEPIGAHTKDGIPAASEDITPIQEPLTDNTPKAEPETEVTPPEVKEENQPAMRLSEIVAEKIEKHDQEIAPQANKVPGSEMPDLKPPEQANEPAAFEIPDLKPPEQKNELTEFEMPNLKPPEQANEVPAFEMPELKPPEQTNEAPGFAMPDLKPPEQANEIPGFEMPEMKPPEQKNEVPEFAMPDLKPPEQANEIPGFEMPELKPPEQANEVPGFEMPEMKPPEQKNEAPGFAMPDLKPPEQANEVPGFAMPDLKPPEQANEVPAFVMPDLKPPEQTNEAPGFAMPDLKPPGQANEVPGFAMSDIKPPEGMPLFNPSVPQEQKNLEVLPPSMGMETQGPPQHPVAPPSTPTEDQESGAKPDKLETNILMYMPRGAKVKKDIIKSLVSRQFSQEDIDRKIQELVAREILVLKIEDGAEQLHRLK